jgi:hypothetical protein
MKKQVIFLVILLIFSASIISASEIEDALHLNIQSVYSNGSIQAGTFGFVFNISTSSDCGNIVYSNSTTLATDSRGIVSYYLGSINLDFNEQYWLCYYKDGTLVNATKFARVPYAYRANITDNLNATANYRLANLTLSQKITFALGEVIDNLADGIIQVTGRLDATGDIFSGGNNLSNAYFYATNGTYYLATNPFSFYNSTTIPSFLSGTGTYGYIPMWNGTSSQNNSNIFQNGSNVGIGTTGPNAKLDVNGTMHIGNVAGVGSMAPLEISYSSDAGLAITSSNTAANAEVYVLGELKDSAGNYRKLGAFDWEWADNDATSGYALWNIHTTKITGGVANDYYGLAVYGDNGAEFFPVNTNDAPGTGILKINGQLHTTGNVGIGTTSPNTKLELDGEAGGAKIRISGYSEARKWDLNMDSAGFGILYNAGAEALKITESGSVGINTTTPGNTLEILNTGSTTALRITDSSNTCDFGVDGTGFTVGSCTSDEKLKTDIQPLSISDINAKINYTIWYANNMKKYYWKSSGEEGVGVIAQDLQAFYPEKVTNIQQFNKETNKAENYLGVTPPSDADLLLTISYQNKLLAKICENMPSLCE